jgi:nitrous oxide reductase accessory protein NosL
MAFFLFDSDFNLNCCDPQALAFGSRKQAEQFQKGFGGVILRFEEAIEEVEKRMKGDLGCHCNK